VQIVDEKLFEEVVRPEEVRVARNLTLKDFYDLRTLRLMLWTLENELCRRYDVKKACDLADKLKPVIEEKIREIEAKL
jgi:hypothetical protein